MGRYETLPWRQTEGDYGGQCGYRKPKDNHMFFGGWHMELAAEQREEPETVREEMAKLGEREM
jgi:hypothetical protein